MSLNTASVNYRKLSADALAPLSRRHPAASHNEKLHALALAQFIHNKGEASGFDASLIVSAARSHKFFRVTSRGPRSADTGDALTDASLVWHIMRRWELLGLIPDEDPERAVALTLADIAFKTPPVTS